MLDNEVTSKDFQPTEAKIECCACTNLETSDVGGRVTTSDEAESVQSQQQHRKNSFNTPGQV